MGSQMPLYVLPNVHPGAQDGAKLSGIAEERLNYELSKRENTLLGHGFGNSVHELDYNFQSSFDDM